VIESPVADLKCLRAGFTNEYATGTWYLAKNILGLWLVQELRRKWQHAGEAWDYARMTAEAAKAPSGPLVNATDGSLMAPSDMEEALLNLIRKGGQDEPADRGQLVRCVLESLALEYAHGLDTIGSLTGDRPGAMYMVGGGIANKLLCQFAANACGIAVHTGADQCTALGNALGQAYALGILKTPDQIRQVMRDSFQMTLYEPQDQSAWSDKRRRYQELRRG
jgi:rhamnulokinase